MDANDTDPTTQPSDGSWSQKYGKKHRFQRIATFPPGIVPPRKIRIYWRNGRHLLQWWDPAARRNLAEPIDGDLVAALFRARQIEQRLYHFRASGQGQRRLDHREFLEQYLADLHRRADAGDIDLATVRRYASALEHYRAFSEQPAVARVYPYAGSVNREFRLQFAAFLAQRLVRANGRSMSSTRPMKAQRYILDTVRALYAWATDPQRGHLLPEGFHNPFLGLAASRSVLHGDPLAEPDITLHMAIDLINAADRFQLRLLVPMLLFGLRAAEPCFLFAEDLDGDWLRVPCHTDLDYRTKGRRDKRFPLLAELQPFWELLGEGRSQGLLFERRGVSEGADPAPWRGCSLAELIAEYRRRCAIGKAYHAVDRLRLRDQLLREAGGLNYDHIQGEFQSLARRLQWPPQATLKDLRHFFATTLNNAALPESYRRYLMGQSPGKTALVAYTHLNQLRQHFTEAAGRAWRPLLTAITQRGRAFMTTGPAQ